MSWKPTEGVLFHQDNTPVHTFVVVMAAWHACGFELISSEFIRFDTELFRKHYAIDDDVISGVENVLHLQERVELQCDPDALQHR